MKTVLYLFFVSLCTLSASSQTMQDIVGEWQFYTIKIDPEKITDKTQSGVELMSSMKLKFNADKTAVLSVIGMTEQARWELNGKNIEYKDIQGKDHIYTIAGFEKNFLTLEKNNKTLVFSRVGADVPPAPILKPQKKYAIATASQLAKKWYLKQRPAPANLTDVQKEAFAEMLSGSYIELKLNDKCALQLGDKKEKGQWNLNDKKNGITSTFKNLPKELYIVRVNATDLVLTEARNDDEWIFSAIE